MSKESFKTIEQHDVDLEYKEPSKFAVIMHNDHYTSVDFVIYILVDLFQKGALEAEEIAMKIHTSGRSIIAIYSFDIARTKVNLVHARAKRAGFPLKCTYEEVGG